VDIFSKKSIVGGDQRTTVSSAAPSAGGFGSKLSVLPSFKAASSESEIEGARWPLVVVVLFAVLVAGGWAGLNYYKKSLDNKIAAVDSRIAELQSNENKESAQKIKQLQQNLKTVRPLLAGHIFSSAALELLEGLTLPQVRYDKFDLKTDGAIISLSGEAQTYNVLAKQIAILNSDKRIVGVETNKVALNQSGGVSFQLTISLDPSLFKK
jgi:Tfp pilus assembly protein PilN